MEQLLCVLLALATLVAVADAQTNVNDVRRPSPARRLRHAEHGARAAPPAPFLCSHFCAHSHRLAYPQMPQLYLMPEVLAGLMAGFVLVLGTCIGVNCLTDIQAPRTFPKAEEKKSL